MLVKVGVKEAVFVTVGVTVWDGIWVKVGLGVTDGVKDGAGVAIGVVEVQPATNEILIRSNNMILLICKPPMTKNLPSLPRRLYKLPE